MRMPFKIYDDNLGKSKRADMMMWKGRQITTSFGRIIGGIWPKEEHKRRIRKNKTSDFIYALWDDIECQRCRVWRNRVQKNWRRKSERVAPEGGRR